MRSWLLAVVLACTASCTGKLSCGRRNEVMEDDENLYAGTIAEGRARVRAYYARLRAREEVNP